jgi:hypothetical protein
MFDEIFGKPLPAQALAAPKMPRDLIRHFNGQSSQGDADSVENILRFNDYYGSPRRW